MPDLKDAQEVAREICSAAMSWDWPAISEEAIGRVAALVRGERAAGIRAAAKGIQHKASSKPRQPGCAKSCDACWLESFAQSLEKEKP